MRNDKSIGELLYERLPDLYKKTDSQQAPVPYPLKRYLQVAGVGLDYIRDKIEGLTNIHDVDRVPSELLPYLFRQLGFDFPYFLTETEQRTLLKVVPTLYRHKGTAKVFEYLGRTIFGNDIEMEAATREGNNIIIDLTATVNGDTRDIDKKTDRFRYFAESFRPVNRSLNVIVALIYFENFTAIKRDNYSFEHVVILPEEDPYTKMKDIWYGTDLVTITDTDSYAKAEKLNDSFSYDVVTLSVESENYSKSKWNDDHSDVGIYTNVVGRGVVGRMRLGKSNTSVNL